MQISGLSGAVSRIETNLKQVCYFCPLLNHEFVVILYFFSSENFNVNHADIIEWI